MRPYNYTERFKPNGVNVTRTLWDRAVRDDRYKLIRTLDGDRFFDLLLDPDEQVPLPNVGQDYDRLSDTMDDWFL